jgi:acetyl esterase/lipase
VWLPAAAEAQDAPATEDCLAEPPAPKAPRLIALKLTKMPVWPGKAPGARDDSLRAKPMMTIYQPLKEDANGTAVVICPGGAYMMIAIDHEGHAIAKWLGNHGVTGIVLRYRHGGHGYRHPIPLQDAQRAIRTIRHKAKELNINPDRIGIMGFSAGGHLASTAGTHFDKGKADAADPIEKVSSRPDFMVLGYPVITLKKPFTHWGSRINLVGKRGDDALVNSLCNETQVTAKTPPTFLFHAKDDGAVPPANSINFHRALVKNKVKAEIHLYEKGGHGFGLGRKGTPAAAWPASCAKWMRGMGLLTKAKPAKSEPPPAAKASQR